MAPPVFLASSLLMILIALKPLFKVNVGEPFEVPDHQAESLVKGGIAAYPEAPPAAASLPQPTPTRRRYQRRDLRAES